MFAQNMRCVYRRNPLGEVICQLRFPEILLISANAPAAFQEAIRAEFPNYSRRVENLPPKVTGSPGQFRLENTQPVINYQFSTLDGIWRVNLTSNFISLSCSRYTCWEDFASKLDQPLAAFIKTYKPACFQRIGLRYLNFISRKELNLEEIPFKELINSCYLGILAEEDISETAASRSTVDTELSIKGGCRAKIHAGPGMVKRPGMDDKEVKFVFDQDLFMAGQIPVNYSTGVMQTLHNQAYSIFRGAISDQLHNAMEPDYR